MKTILGAFSEAQRRDIVDSCGLDGWIHAPGISGVFGIPSIWVASAKDFIERGDDAMKRVGYDGAQIYPGLRIRGRE